MDISGNNWLSGLAPADLDELRPRLQAIDLRLADVVQNANEPVEWVHFPLHGLLSLVYHSRDGQTVEVGMVGREGASNLLESCGSGLAFIVALVQIQGRALRAPASAIRALHETSASFRAAVALQAEMLLIESRESVVCQALHSAEARCARWLLESRDRSGCGDTVPLTQEHLAAMLGVQRTTVSAVASELQRINLIRYSRGRIAILDGPGLERVACECRGVTRGWREKLADRARR